MIYLTIFYSKQFFTEIIYGSGFLAVKTSIQINHLTDNFHFKLFQGKNYTIFKRTSSQNSSFLMKNDQKTASTNPITIPQKYSDLTQAKLTSWSEFASWNHLENTCPYWWYCKWTRVFFIKMVSAVHNNDTR